MALLDLSGIGAVQEALQTTNTLLADVLSELKRVNDESFPALVEEVRRSRAL